MGAADVVVAAGGAEVSAMAAAEVVVAAGAAEVFCVAGSAGVPET